MSALRIVIAFALACVIGGVTLLLLPVKLAWISLVIAILVFVLAALAK